MKRATGSAGPLISLSRLGNPTRHPPTLYCVTLYLSCIISCRTEQFSPITPRPADIPSRPCNRRYGSIEVGSWFGCKALPALHPCS